ncbi:hypothetical protein CEXT_701931 [Caerostris extrusa]|uniref:Uncharacterized protein n=1 Tax=Caerostris extrusa TaxID=172846 RepID=A0AAV4VKN8_CAEEX|nr:hypothetical protein CEXT_701931 [Caerostris extrusa]
MLGNRLIGPYLLPEELTGHSYLVLGFLLIRDVLSDVLDNMTLTSIRGLWIQHDGTSAYFSSLVCHWLDIEYAGRWTGAVVLFHGHHYLPI